MNRSRMKRFLLGLAVVLLASAAGVELGARLLDRARGRPWEASKSRAATEEICRTLARRSFTGEDEQEKPGARLGLANILQPYTGWEQVRTQQRIVQAAEWYAGPQAESVYDVCVLGGSVAQSFLYFGIPVLKEVLARDPRFEGRELRFHNFACAGYKQPQSCLLLAYLLVLGHEPDVVIELDGFNEAALSWRNSRSGTHPLYPSVAHWAQTASGAGLDSDFLDELHEVRATQDRARSFGEWFLRSGLWKSCFLDHVLLLRLEKLRRRYVEAHDRLMKSLEERPESEEIRGPEFEADDESLARAIVGAWVECSASMHGMCRARGIAYLHVLQPTLHDEGSKPLTQKEIDGAKGDPVWIEGVKKVYPLLRQAGSQLEARGVPFLDASGVFGDHPEDIYHDICHFKQRGNEILAEAIARALLESGKR